ncbi:MAG: hypothetical protein GX556_17415 [Fibrobacter sp.]|nr:hypothetical protein [Fibrobacter sp.]
MATTQELYEQVFNTGNIWNVSSQMSKVDSNTLGVLITAGIIIGFAVASIQLFSSLFLVYRDKNTNLMDFLAPLVLKMVLAAAVMNPAVYPMIVHYVFAAPADAVANMVTMTYIDNFLSDYSQVMNSIADSPNKVTSLISATLDGSLISTLIAGLFFWAAAICAYITPMIQGMLFLFVYFAGPICIGFSLCDYTVGVFHRWVSMLLTICWLGFFGSCSFLVIDSCQLLSHLSGAAGGDKPNVILTMIYGAVSILLFCSCFPITSFFFSSIGEMTRFTNPVSTITGTAGGMTGGAAVGGVSAMMLGGIGKAAGAGLSRVSRDRSWMRSLADSMQKISGGTVAGGKVVAENSGVRVPHGTSSLIDGRSGGKSPNIPKPQEITGDIEGKKELNGEKVS